MYREVESHFANVPSLDIQRTRMSIPSEHKTTFNVGDVIPIYYDGDILPGDTVEMTHSAVVRLQTLLTPIMDNMVLDFYWFFVPYRLVWNHWKEFMQENTAGPWAPTTQYQIPSISAPSGGFASGTLADYFGYPVGLDWANTNKNAPSALPFRVYAEIMNEFFRDENLSYPLNVPKNDSNQTGTNGSSYINDVANGGMPFKAARNHDYFSSCLPSAQKNTQPVTFPLLSNTTAPVKTMQKSAMGITSGQIPLVMGSQASQVSYGNLLKYGTAATSNEFDQGVFNVDIGFNQGVSSSWKKTYESDVLWPVNLWADLSNSVGAVTVNELRLAFQLQKWYERAAVGGSRYTELIRSMFSVVSPDARLQRPEYLGGNRVPVVINEVVNTSSDSGSSAVPLGNLGANSNTSDVNTDFIHSFTEHGALIGLAVCRTANHSFSQGIERQYLRKVWTDFYWPVFAHLGEMPVKEVQIYADGYMDSDDVFGYQEAWAEYRYRPSRTSGLMRPGISGTLASWHLGDYYTSAPVLSDSWIREPLGNVDRVLAVTSSVSNQLFGDFYFDAKYTRPMPVYSVPGLIDHF